MNANSESIVDIHAYPVTNRPSQHVQTLSVPCKFFGEVSGDALGWDASSHAKGSFGQRLSGMDQMQRSGVRQGKGNGMFENLQIQRLRTFLRPIQRHRNRFKHGTPPLTVIFGPVRLQRKLQHQSSQREVG